LAAGLLPLCRMVGASVGAAEGAAADGARPNLIFIFIDDHRFDALGCAGNPAIHTPNLDKLARRGVRFENAFVTLSICAPSRAAVLTGRYGSATGVTNNAGRLRPAETTFAQLLKRAGYRTGFVGKWHQSSRTPAQCGFDDVVWFTSNGPHFNRKVIERGEPAVARGFIEDYLAARSVEFLESAAEGEKEQPFVLHYCTQVPHMDHQFDWKPRPETLVLYPRETMPLPATWQDDLGGKPPYLKTARSRTQALKYGYDRAENVREHFRRYYGAITEMDAALGNLLAAVDRLSLRQSTYVVVMGDNGWMIGDHGFTSKVLAYEPSIHVPLIVAGPGIEPGVRDELVLNIDVPATLLDAAGIEPPKNLHGRSLLPLVRGGPVAWREEFLYEAPDSQLGSRPLFAVRAKGWKYIRTLGADGSQADVFEEFYDLGSDPNELRNLAGRAEHEETIEAMRRSMERLRRRIEP
jgi:arylsulfatase A-like enzyme